MKKLTMRDIQIADLNEQVERVNQMIELHQQTTQDRSTIRQYECLREEFLTQLRPLLVVKTAKQPESQLQKAEANVINVAKEKLLANAFNQYNIHQSFQAGTLIQWKMGMKNRPKPNYNEPAIVMDVLAVPIDSAANTEKLDIKLGLILENGEFALYLYDKNRFEPYLSLNPMQNQSVQIDATTNP
jgi:hypothetical protein